jgi:hypothetical protein
MCWVVEKKSRLRSGAQSWTCAPSVSGGPLATSHPPLAFTPTALAPMSPSSALGAPSNVAALHVHAFGPAAFEGTALPWSDSTTDWRRHPPSRSRLPARPCCFTADGTCQRTLGAVLIQVFHPLLRATARTHRNQAFCFLTALQIGVQASASMWSSIRHRTS